MSANVTPCALRVSKMAVASSSKALPQICKACMTTNPALQANRKAACCLHVKIEIKLWPVVCCAYINVLSVLHTHEREGMPSLSKIRCCSSHLILFNALENN